MKESIEAFEARRRFLDRVRSEPITAPAMKRWTFNQSLTDAALADYYAGLVIVSRPGALYGPEDALAPGHTIRVRFPAEDVYGPLKARTVPARIERVREQPEYPYAVVVQEGAVELRAVVQASWLV